MIKRLFYLLSVVVVVLYSQVCFAADLDVIISGSSVSIKNAVEMNLDCIEYDDVEIIHKKDSDISIYNNVIDSADSALISNYVLTGSF